MANSLANRARGCFSCTQDTANRRLKVLLCVTLQIGGVYIKLLCRLLLSGDRNSLRAVLTDWCLEVLLMITGDVIESNRSIIVPVSNISTDIKPLTPEFSGRSAI